MDISKNLIDICNNRSFRRLLENDNNSIYLEELLRITSFLDQCYDSVDLSQRIWHIRNNSLTLTLCKNCGRPMTFNRSIYRCIDKDCRRERTSASLKEVVDKTIQKYKETCLQKYGVDNAMKNEKFVKKQHETNLSKYGVEVPSVLEEVKEKSKQTCLQKYGVDNIAKTEEARKNNPMKSETIKKKVTETNILKYGVSRATKLDQCKEKYKETCLQKYGAKNYSNSLEMRNRFASKFIKNGKNNEFLFLSGKYEFVKYIGRQCYIFKCNKCGKEFYYYSNRQNRINSDVSICYHCVPQYGGISFLEKSLLKYVKSIYKGEIIANSRKIISPYELDIYLPELKLAIEFNGDIFHANPKIYKDPNEKLYPYRKTNAEKWERDKLKNQLANELGIKLITVWENDYVNDQKTVLKNIKSIINESVRLV